MSTRLQDLAKQHLMMHFADMSVEPGEIPVLVRGEGSYVFDDQGRRFIDGLSGLYCSNLGHSHGEAIGVRAAEQMAALPYVSNWSTAHPPAIELAAALSEKAPSNINRVFFTSGGSESVESAYKLARQYHQTNGEPERRKVIARNGAYHGSTLGALSFTGIPGIRTPFEPMAVQVPRVSNTVAYRSQAYEQGGEEALTKALLDEIENVIEFERPETIAMIIAEPVQNAGGSIVPPKGYWQGLRDICDRYGILLVSDEVICAFGRLGHWFGAQRFDYLPDMITVAKGMTGAYAPMGAVLISDKVAEPFVSGKDTYLHGYTFGGHPVVAAVALGALEVYEEEKIFDNVLANEPKVLELLEGLKDIPIVGDVRGMGHFFAIEVVRDQNTAERITDDEGEWLLQGVLTGYLEENGMICRLDDRAEPFIQIAPPLVAGMEEFEQITEILRGALEHTAEALEKGKPA